MHARTGYQLDLDWVMIRIHNDCRTASELTEEVINTEDGLRVLERSQNPVLQGLMRQVQDSIMFALRLAIRNLGILNPEVRDAR